MTEERLKECLTEYPFLKYFVSLKGEKIGITLSRQPFFRKYTVIKWTEFEYGQFDKDSKKQFKKKEEAINYIWELFGGDKELNNLIEIYNKKELIN